MSAVILEFESIVQKEGRLYADTMKTFAELRAKRTRPSLEAVGRALDELIAHQDAASARLGRRGRSAARTF